MKEPNSQAQNYQHIYLMDLPRDFYALLALQEYEDWNESNIKTAENVVIYIPSYRLYLAICRYYLNQGNHEKLHHWESKAASILRESDYKKLRKEIQI